MNHTQATHYTREHCTIRFASFSSAQTNSSGCSKDVERRPYRLVQGRFIPTEHHVEPSPKKNVRINAEYPSMQFIGGRTTIAHKLPFGPNRGDFNL
ncbi:MAG: hypothetical protein ABR920_19105 [Terriglobales bacterium]